MRRLLLILSWPLAAAAAAPADLPPTDLVERVLKASPAVRAAAAGIDVEAANRDRLGAGPHEYSLRLASQQRREQLVDRRYREHEIGIERAVRLPGKAEKDAELGAIGVELARTALGDALHESARDLLARWCDWQREAVAVREWTVQTDILRRQLNAAAKRVAAGDAARLEALLAEAQLAQGEAQLAQAQAARDRAAAELSRLFPGLPLPADSLPAEPQPTAGAAESWRQRLVENNHELRLAGVAARRGQLAARRIDAERMPDPTVGLWLGSERDGQERIVGVQLSIPFGGAARAAGARAGQAEAAVAAAREAQALARAEAEAQRAVNMAGSSYAQWRRLSEVAGRMDENARLLDKAWRLGEGQFTELQMARRLAAEARLAAAQAQIDANAARYRLLLDAHALWAIDTDGHAQD